MYNTRITTEKFIDNLKIKPLTEICELLNTEIFIEKTDVNIVKNIFNLLNINTDDMTGTSIFYSINNNGNWMSSKYSYNKYRILDNILYDIIIEKYNIDNVQTLEF